MFGHCLLNSCSSTLIVFKEQFSKQNRTMIYIFWSFQSSTHAPYIFNMYIYWLTLMCCWISNCDTQQKITHPRASWARSGFEPVLCYTTLHPQFQQQYESFFWEISLLFCMSQVFGKSYLKLDDECQVKRNVLAVFCFYTDVHRLSCLYYYYNICVH